MAFLPALHDGFFEMADEPQDVFSFHQYLEGDNYSYNGEPFNSILTLSPPNSCPVTPTHASCLEVQQTEDFQSNAPELEHYLRQTTPHFPSQKRTNSVSLQMCAGSKNKKAKLSEWNKYSFDEGRCTDAMDSSPCQKAMKWNIYQSEKCHDLYSSSFLKTEPASLKVTCDKGFTFSFTENVFICQKKNHFQVTLLFSPPNSECYIKNDESYEPVSCYKVHLYAVKAEIPNSRVYMEQSSADRSKHPYHPIKYPCPQKSLTIGRLHFSETTSNNMRKKGKLNPDQRYFVLVVDLRAHTKKGNYSICCQASQKLIVRASNPGQFENDIALWSKGKYGDAVHRMGQVGINTDKVEECLCVNGNMQLSGHMLQPSDIRIMRDVSEQTTTRACLENIVKMKIYKFSYSQEFLDYASLPDEEHYGILGHEVEPVVPGVIQGTYDFNFSDGKVLKDVVHINKDRLLMECIGAMKEICHVTKTMNSRILDLQKRNEMLELILKNPTQFPL